MASNVGGAAWYGSSSPWVYNYYNVAAGNFVVFFLQFDAAVSAVSISSMPGYGPSNTLTAGPVIGDLYCFYGSGGNYYWGISWTGSANVAAVVEDYSGATAVSLTNSATASGTSGTASASLTTDDPGGNLIVAGMGNAAGNTFTATVGTQRQNESSITPRVILLDNSNSSPGSLACTSTLTSCDWDVIIIELRTLILSDHFKSGQRLSLQNRPTGLAVQD